MALSLDPCTNESPAAGLHEPGLARPQSTPGPPARWSLQPGRRDFVRSQPIGAIGDRLGPGSTF